MVMNAETKGMFLTMGDRTGSLWAGVRGMPVAIHVLALPTFKMPQLHCMLRVPTRN